MLEQAPCGKIIPEYLPADAIQVGSWDVSSISDDADSDEVPDFLAAAGNNPGHVHMLCEILQFMAQGRTVAISGVSAGSPTHIWHGRFVSHFYLFPRFDLDI